MFNHDPSINNFKNSHSRTYYWGVAIAVVLLVGLTYQKTTQAIYRLAISPPGEILNVQGIDTHLYCVGRGSPTVVLQAGAVSFAQSWAWVQQELANTTRVCSYDRPGLGWSDAGDDDLSGTELAHHLHELLQQAGEPGPYVLVGHSMGGPLVQIFTGLYPEHVIAVGLVDPTHPNLLAIYPDQAIPQKRGFTLLIRVSSVLAYTGIVRASDLLAQKAEGLPKDAYHAAAFFSSSPKHLSAAYRELNAWHSTMASARQYMQLDERPALVISASRATAEMPQSYMKPLQSLHADLASMSANSRHVKVAGADHFTLLTKPDTAALTASELQKLVHKTRGERSVTDAQRRAQTPVASRQ